MPGVPLVPIKRAGLAYKRDIGEKHWLRRVLLKELQSPAEEMPIER